MKHIITKISVLFFALLAFSCGRKTKTEATGAFEATEVVVSAEANGKIISFTANEGSEVKKGQVLGYIDTVQLYLKKEQLIATRAATESQKQDIQKQIAATKEQLKTQNREQERTKVLFSKNAATQKNLDDVNSAVAVLEKQLTAQISSLENTNKSLSNQGSSLNIQVAQIEDQITKSIITSPVEGTVLSKYAEQGELANLGKVLFKLADLNEMFLRAYITGAQLTEIKLAQKVKVFCDMGSSNYREYEGIITWISSQSEFTPKTIQTKDERANLVYAVKIAVKNDGFIKIGMYGEISF